MNPTDRVSPLFRRWVESDFPAVLSILVMLIHSLGGRVSKDSDKNLLGASPTFQR